MSNKPYSISVLAFQDAKKGAEKVLIPVEISIETLSNNLANFVKTLGTIVESFPETYKKNYALEEIDFSLSVDASGSIALIGEVSAGITTGITVTFKKTATS
jgi:hypothetical protein